MTALLAVLSMSAASATGGAPVQRLWVTTNPEVYSYHKAAVDASGNVYAAGNTLSDGTLHLVKYTASGAKLWQRSYPPSSAAEMLVGPDGNVVIAGSMDSNSRVFKVSATGNILWDKVGPINSTWRAMAIDSIGEISVTGSVPFGSDQKIRTSHFRPDGVQTWQRDYTHPQYVGFDQTGFALECDSSGNIYFLAKSPSPTTHTALGKYSRTGQLGWIRHMPEAANSVMRGVDFTLYEGSKIAVASVTSNGEYNSAYIVLTTYDGDGTRLARVLNPSPFTYQYLEVQEVVSLPGSRFSVLASSAGNVTNSPDWYSFKMMFSPASIIETSLGPGVIHFARTGLGGEEYYAGTEFLSVNMTYIPPNARIFGIVEPSPANPGMSWVQAVWGTGEASAAGLVRDLNGDLVMVGGARSASGPRGFIARYACPPVARDDRYTAATGAAFEIAAPGVRVNDVQASNAALSLMQPPLHGTMTLANDGGLTYVPDPGFTGEDSARYKLTRGPYSATGEIIFNVQ